MKGLGTPNQDQVASNMQAEVKTEEVKPSPGTSGLGLFAGMDFASQPQASQPAATETDYAPPSLLDFTGSTSTPPMSGQTSLFSFMSVNPNGQGDILPSHP